MKDASSEQRQLTAQAPAKRFKDTRGPKCSAEIIELVKALERQDDALASPSCVMPIAGPVTLPITESDARLAGGTDDRAFNAKLIRQTVAAVVRANDPEVAERAAEALAALKSIGPRGAVESGIAGLFVAASDAAMDCFKVARTAGFTSPIGVVMLARAEKLTCRAAELAEAFARQRSRGKQLVRVEHVHIHEGGQAIVGSVAHGR